VDAWGLKSNPVGAVPLPIVSEGDKQLVLQEDLHRPSTRPDSAQVRIVLGCTDHADFRKGADLAALALQWLMARHPEINLDVYGKNSDLILESLPEHSNRILLHGYLTSEEQYKDILAGGDIFLGTSREETLGQTFVEAAHAGLITVGPMASGYTDIVNSCRYSIGYSSIDVLEIVGSVEHAIELLSKNDRATIRLIQKCQAQANFSGVSFLSAFNHYLYNTGLWKRLNYCGPTKIFDLEYRDQAINEVVFFNLDRISKYPPNEDKIEISLPVSCWKLGPDLYLEDVGADSVAWLNLTSTFLINAGNAAGTRILKLCCHWIPESVRETACELKICGFGAIASLIPSQGEEIVFDLTHLRKQGRLLPPKLLCSLTFEKAINLDDGRQNLTVVCKELTLC
jgi:hypothetical protein